MILRLVRIGVPAAIAAAGVVFLIAGEGENDQGAGIALIGVALVVLMLNVALRLGVSSKRDREARGGRARAVRPHRAVAGRRVVEVS